VRPVLLVTLSLFPGLVPPAASQGLLGDTADHPFLIGSLPFSDSGNSCDFTHQYDEFCPIDGQNAPDVVYAYEATESVVVNVSLCESAYDTKILVYENVAYTGNLYACNDDWCTGPDYPWPWLAYLRDLTLHAGNTYYFVVDGYSTASCGPYVLRIAEAQSCTLTCPPGGLEESEPKCVSTAAPDSINSGCATDPPVFETMPPSSDPVVFCSYTNANGGLHPDQDWYELVLSSPDTITVSVQADIAAFATVFDGNAGCPDPPVLASLVTAPCELASRPVAVPAGPVWIRVQSLLQWMVLCPASYVLSVGGYDGTLTAIPSPSPSSPPRLTIVPNPTTGAVAIRGTVAGPGEVTVRVLDVRGRVVRTLHHGPLDPGPLEILWDGRDDRGGPVPSGIYFCRWRDAGRVSVGRIVRIRS